MDLPKINNSYISADNIVSEVFESNNKNENSHSYQQNEDENPAEHQEDDKNIFLKSFIKNSETFTVSTNEWLGTWRPLIYRTR